MRWAPLRGVLGAATGVIAIGMVATSTSTTTIILIRTTILIATSVAKAATGNTIRNTAGTLRTATEEPRTSSVVRVPGEPVIAAAQVTGRAVRAALGVPEDPVVLVALGVPEDPVVPAV